MLGTTKVERDGAEIDLAPPWRRLTLRDAIRERTGIDVLEHPTREALAAAMDSEPGEEEGWGKLVDGLLSKEVEPELIQPTFILDYPVEMSPFAKRHRADDRPRRALGGRSPGGFEIANAFSELNDPDEQRRAFPAAGQMARERRRRGAADGRGLHPGARVRDAPRGGVGLGIDRLVMLLTGAHSLREVILFPAMRWVARAPWARRAGDPRGVRRRREPGGRPPPADPRPQRDERDAPTSLSSPS